MLYIAQTGCRWRYLPGGRSDHGPGSGDAVPPLVATAPATSSSRTPASSSRPSRPSPPRVGGESRGCTGSAAWPALAGWVAGAAAAVLVDSVVVANGEPRS